MKIQINIRDSHILIILLLMTAASAIGLVVAYGGTQPSLMGHTWGEMECAGCIINSNLADSSVTSAKIADGSIIDADISATAAISGSKVTGTVPAATSAGNADTVDGLHASNLYIICGWTGWSSTGGVSCPSGSACEGHVTVSQLYCSGGRVTQTQTASVCSGCAPIFISTPYIASWNGNGYAVENDIMFGYPTSFRPDYLAAKAMYESGAVYMGKDGSSPFAYNRISRIAYDRGDTYKLQLPFVPKDGRYSFLILEHDPEESFMDELRLQKVVHDEGTEIFVKSDLSQIYALDTGSMETPQSCVTDNGQDCVEAVSDPGAKGDALSLAENDYADITFAYADLGSTKLLLRAKYEEKQAEAVFEPAAQSEYNIFTDIASRLYRMFDILPSAYAYASIRVLYQDKNGEWKLIGIMHPRDLNYITEVVEIPEEAIQAFRERGEIKLRLLWTGTHSLSFAGLLPDGKSGAFTIEELSPTKAYHHRLGSDFARQLSAKDFDYMPTMQGDVVEVEFPTGSETLEGKKATFLVASEGFYTNLRAYLYPDADFGYYRKFWNTREV